MEEYLKVRVMAGSLRRRKAKSKEQEYGSLRSRDRHKDSRGSWTGETRVYMEAAMATARRGMTKATGFLLPVSPACKRLSMRLIFLISPIIVAFFGVWAPLVPLNSPSSPLLSSVRTGSG